jgi:hypothetical protein
MRGPGDVAGDDTGNDQEMVTPMAEQSGPTDPSERPASDRPASDRPGSGRPGSDRSRQSSPPPRVDLVGDLNRWLIRQGAKNVRKEIGGQVRRTLGGGRSSTADVWDTVTNEIPPEVGEAPECQWCPICRAARRMRESGPGIGGQLSGAGGTVAGAVQDAINALDGFLSKGGGGSAQRDAEPRGTAARGNEPQGAGPRVAGPRGTGPQRAAPQATEPWSTVTDAETADRPASDPAAADAGTAPADDDPGTPHDGAE